MGVVVVETNYRRFEPVGQGIQCEDCPSGCKTSCARLLASENRTVLMSQVEISQINECLINEKSD